MQIAEVYASGKTIREIAAEFRLSSQTVWKALKQCGKLRTSEESRVLRVLNRTHKRCQKCKDEFDMESFTRNRASTDGRNALCPACRRAYMTSYKSKPASTSKRRASRLKTYYGLTPEVYQELMDHQNGLCAICVKPFVDVDPELGKGSSLTVDHDHQTGLVRGLLHRNCNAALGLLKDDVATLGRAMEYLQVGGVQYNGEQVKSARFRTGG